MDQSPPKADLGSESGDSDRELQPLIRSQDGTPHIDVSSAKAHRDCKVQDDGKVLLQIWLLACSRGVLMLTRICMGPLVVAMEREYQYTAAEKGEILSAFAAGYAMTQVIGGIAADRFGGAPVLALGLFSSGLSLVMLPWVAARGVPSLCLVIWTMGFIAGPTYPALQSMIGRWATVSLRSYASALNGAGASAGSLLALGLTPVLSGRLGWRVTTCSFGGSVLAFAFLWSFRGRSAPAEDLEYVEISSPKIQSDSAQAWYKALRLKLCLFLSLPVFVIIVAHSVHNFVRYFLFAWMPTYFDQVLGISADARGLLMTLPEFFSTASGMVAANVSRSLQKRGLLSTLGCRRWFAAVAFVGQGVSLLAMSFVTSPFAVTLLLCSIQVFSALQGPGFHANYLDVTVNSSGLVVGVGDSFATMASGCGTMLASKMLDGVPREDYAAAWRLLFQTYALSNVVGLVMFVPCSSAAPVDASRMHGG